VAKKKQQDYTPGQQIDVGDLARRVCADRVARRMTWPDYAAFLGLSQSAIYKIARGKISRPHDLTVANIEAKLQTPIKPAKD